MALVKRANVVLTISDDYLDNYLSQGYKQIDEHGKVINAGIPITLNDYILAYSELQKKCKQLESDNALLKNSNEELTKKLKAVKSTKKDN